MDIQRELKNDLTSITGVVELQDGIYLPLEQVEKILVKRLEQVKKLIIADVIVPKGTLLFHLKALTKQIADSHCYGFEDVLEDYIKSNAL